MIVIIICMVAQTLWKMESGKALVLHQRPQSLCRWKPQRDEKRHRHAHPLRTNVLSLKIPSTTILNQRKMNLPSKLQGSEKQISSEYKSGILTGFLCKVRFLLKNETLVSEVWWKIWNNVTCDKIMRLAKMFFGPVPRFSSFIQHTRPCCMDPCSQGPSCSGIAARQHMLADLVSTGHSRGEGAAWPSAKTSPGTWRTGCLCESRLKGWLLCPCCSHSLPDPAGLQLAQVCQTHWLQSGDPCERARGENSWADGAILRGEHLRTVCWDCPGARVHLGLTCSLPFCLPQHLLLF